MLGSHRMFATHFFRRSFKVAVALALVLGLFSPSEVDGKSKRAKHRTSTTSKKNSGVRSLNQSRQSPFRRS
jgi:hypothetical protein